ncbi:hypothetical protein [Streptomyces sp. NPDC057253]|uniref:hypothetical protein n=1 Tax=Streptomyces sp. NPDC057253 TaxID=3346069 RepID=UPI00362A254D
MRTRMLSAVVAGSATAALLLTGVGTATAAPAKAAWDGNIYLYYSTASNSAWRAYSGGTADFGSDTFNSGVDGYGQRVKNNVNRAFNNDQHWAANIWYNENFQGAVDTFSPGEARQLKVGVRNDNASLSWTYVG